MSFLHAHWKDDDDESFNDARVRRDQEDKPLFTDCTQTALRIIEHYVRTSHDRVDKKTLKKLVDREVAYLKKKGII